MLQGESFEQAYFANMKHTNSLANMKQNKMPISAVTIDNSGTWHFLGYHFQNNVCAIFVGLLSRRPAFITETDVFLHLLFFMRSQCHMQRNF